MKNEYKNYYYYIKFDYYEYYVYIYIILGKFKLGVIFIT